MTGKIIRYEYAFETWEQTVAARERLWNKVGKNQSHYLDTRHDFEDPKFVRLTGASGDTQAVELLDVGHVRCKYAADADPRMVDRWSDQFPGCVWGFSGIYRLIRE